MSTEKDIIPILKEDENKPLSRLQKHFNSRIKRINKAKSDIEVMEKKVKNVQLQIAENIHPLERKIAASRCEEITLLDKWYPDVYFKRKEKKKLKELIVNGSMKLIAEDGLVEMKPIFDKHSKESYDKIASQEAEQMKKVMKDEIKEATGIDMDLEDIDMDNPEAFFAQMMHKMKEHEGEILDYQEKKEEEAKSGSKEKKKTKAQLKKEEEKKTEMKNISKITKTIYNGLVKEFHPDKELDEKEKEWKTEIMKKVTIAYQEDDLFALLKLRLELTTHEEAQLQNLPEDELKHYNTILLEQLKELETKLWNLKNPPPPFDHLEDYLRCRTPKSLAKKIMEEVDELEYNLYHQEGNVSYFQDRKNVKKFLRDYTLEEDRPMMPDFLSDMLDNDDFNPFNF